MSNRYSVPVNRAHREVTLKAYPFFVEIWDGTQLLAQHPRCYEREQDIFNPLHYLPLLEQRPGAFIFSRVATISLPTNPFVFCHEWV